MLVSSKYVPQKSVWCDYNQITERSGEELRRIRTMYRGLGQGLLNAYSTWDPHVPISPVEGAVLPDLEFSLVLVMPTGQKPASAADGDFARPA